MKRFIVDFIFILLLLMISANTANQEVNQNALDQFESKIIQKQTIIHYDDLPNNKANQLAIETGVVIEKVVKETLNCFYELYDGLINGN